MKRKVCKMCKAFVEGAACEKCGSNQFSNNWKGRLFILNPTDSSIAKKINIEKEGEYAIKVR